MNIQELFSQYSFCLNNHEFLSIIFDRINLNNNIVTVKNIMFQECCSSLALYYVLFQVVDPVCHQLFDFYRSLNVELQRFTLELVPSLIWTYLQALANNDKSVSVRILSKLCYTFLIRTGGVWRIYFGEGLTKRVQALQIVWSYMKRLQYETSINWEDHKPPAPSHAYVTHPCTHNFFIFLNNKCVLTFSNYIISVTKFIIIRVIYITRIIINFVTELTWPEI